MQASIPGHLLAFVEDAHFWPIILALLGIGIFGAIEMLSGYALRVMGSVAEAYYEMRSRLYRSRQEFEKLKRGNDPSRFSTRDSHP